MLIVNKKNCMYITKALVEGTKDTCHATILCPLKCSVSFIHLLTNLIQLFSYQY